MNSNILIPNYMAAMRPAVPRNAAAQPPAQAQPRAQAQPQPQQTAAQPRREPTAQVDKMIDSAAVSKILSGGIKGGDRITIRGSNGDTLEISKKKVSAFANFRAAAADLVRVSSAEVSNIVAQDPAFAFKEAAFAVQSQVFSGIPDGLTQVASQGFLPMIRVVSLALDLKKAHETWKAEGSTHVDKAITGAHLATDLAGIGGAVAMAVPQFGSAIATTLTAVGLMGDLAAYGYHVMKYFKDRGAPVPPPDPNPTPDPTPEPTPDPNPTPDPVPTPDPAPTPDPNPAPEPDPVPPPAPAPDPGNPGTPGGGTWNLPKTF